MTISPAQLLPADQKAEARAAQAARTGRGSWLTLGIGLALFAGCLAGLFTSPTGPIAGMWCIAMMLTDQGIKYGLQTMCEGGGQANATILELL